MCSGIIYKEDELVLGIVCCCDVDKHIRLGFRSEWFCLCTRPTSHTIKLLICTGNLRQQIATHGLFRKFSAT